MSRILRATDIALFIVLCLTALYAYLRPRLYRSLPRNLIDVKLILVFFVVLAAGVAAMDYYTGAPYTVSISTSGVLLSPQGGLFGVYWDVTGVSEVQSVDWGTLEPGEYKTVQLWVKNMDSHPIYVNMTTMNWSPPEAETYMTAAWGWGDSYLYPGMSRKVPLTLHVHGDISGVDSFQFTIHLSS